MCFVTTYIIPVPTIAHTLFCVEVTRAIVRVIFEALGTFIVGGRFVAFR